MKHVLIFGAGSYIGRSFKSYWDNCYSIDMISGRSTNWESSDFSKFDAVLFCAGLAHIKQTSALRGQYFAVNRDLAVCVAEKAKAAGVPQFIYISSMSVYGRTTGVISASISPRPRDGDAYGQSKLEAERLLQRLADDSFCLTVLRPPMVYGYGCKGNFPRLVGLVKKLPAFPVVDNQRSMIYIENLCRFMAYCVDQKLSGLYCPQNLEFVNTTTLVEEIAQALGKSLHTSQMAGHLLPLVAHSATVQKVFGSLYFDESLRIPDENRLSYVSFHDSIQYSVKGAII